MYGKMLNYLRTYPQQAIEAGEEPDQDAGNESGKNQFNYSERAAQTFNNPMRERGVVTEPPPMLSFRNTVAQWEIYDSYMAEYSAQVRCKNGVDDDKTFSLSASVSCSLPLGSFIGLLDQSRESNMVTPTRCVDRDCRTHFVGG